jgi:GTP-binding protein
VRVFVGPAAPAPGGALLLDEILGRVGARAPAPAPRPEDADPAGGEAGTGRNGGRDRAEPAAAHGSGRGRHAHHDINTEVPETRIAIVGRPNVGKSSLVNRLLREQRVLVSDMPGTTRDAIDVPLLWHRRHLRIVDTAGMRRPGRVRTGGKVELVSVALAKEAMADADVVVLMLDAKEGATDQDAAIGGEIDRAGRGIVIVANKWDLVRVSDSNFARDFDDRLRRKMRFLDYAPILHVSALTGERSTKVLETVDQVAEARRKRVPTPALNRFVEAVTAANPPVSPGRRHVRILYAAQIGVAPPSFVFFTNVATTFHFSYERFLINQLRDEFGFVGSPIRLQVRRRGKN